MAMNKINIQQCLSGYVIDCTVVGFKRFKVRWWIASRLLRVAFLIMDMRICFWDDRGNKLE
jgi:hypothetical protein